MFLHIYFSELHCENPWDWPYKRILIAMLTWMRTQVYITQYMCDFIDSIRIRKIPHANILYRCIVQTYLSIAYIQQKYSYPYRIFAQNVLRQYCDLICQRKVNSKDCKISILILKWEAHAWKNSLIE